MGQKHDVDEVLSHPFFKGIDMNLLLQKKIEAPYKPKIENSENVSPVNITESVLGDEQIKKIQEKKDQFEQFGFERIDQ